MKGLLIAFICSLLCCDFSEAPTESVPQQSVSFELLFEDAISNITSPSEEIITSQERYQEIFDAINSTRKPSLDPPTIDFSKEALVFVNLGYRPTGGYSVSIDRIEKDSQEYTVFVSGEEPKTTDMVMSVLTYPWTLVKIEKPALPVVFRRTEQ